MVVRGQSVVANAIEWLLQVPSTITLSSLPLNKFLSRLKFVGRHAARAGTRGVGIKFMRSTCPYNLSLGNKTQFMAALPRSGMRRKKKKKKKKKKKRAICDGRTNGTNNLGDHCSPHRADGDDERRAPTKILHVWSSECTNQQRSEMLSVSDGAIRAGVGKNSSI